MLLDVGIVVFKRWYQFFAKPKKILFYRDIVAPHGGHHKVADYFDHVRTAAGYTADIAFSERSRWDSTNPWFPEFQLLQVQFEPQDYDYVFLAGTDWQMYLSKELEIKKPVINLIQHVRHAEPAEDVHQFLSQPAIRICVSQEVADAILATDKVNGPVITIPNGLSLPELGAEKSWDVLILGIKQPALALQLAESLVPLDLRVLIVDKWIPRADLYAQMAASRVALLLPNPTEGFYLPALEAMHFCDLVVVPDAVGNRGFCIDGKNCLIPDYNLDALLLAFIKARYLLSDSNKLSSYKTAARETIEQFSSGQERNKFHAVLSQVDELWKRCDLKQAS